MQPTSGQSDRSDPASGPGCYEHGWQSWSPSAGVAPFRLARRDLSNRERAHHELASGHRTTPADAFWGEGLLALDPGDGGEVGPSSSSAFDAGIRSPRSAPTSVASTVHVSADGDVTRTGRRPRPARSARPSRGGPIVSRPRQRHGHPTRPHDVVLLVPLFHRVTADDIDENISPSTVRAPRGRRPDRRRLSGEIGDWLTPRIASRTCGGSSTGSETRAPRRHLGCTVPGRRALRAGARPSRLGAPGRRRSGRRPTGTRTSSAST